MLPWQPDLILTTTFIIVVSSLVHCWPFPWALPGTFGLDVEVETTGNFWSFLVHLVARVRIWARLPHKNEEPWNEYIARHDHFINTLLPKGLIFFLLQCTVLLCIFNFFQTNLPVFKVKESSVRRRYSDFKWLRNELERDSKVTK